MWFVQKTERPSSQNMQTSGKQTNKTPQTVAIIQYM